MHTLTQSEEMENHTQYVVVVKNTEHYNKLAKPKYNNRFFEIWEDFMKSFGKKFLCVVVFVFFIAGYASGKTHYVTQDGAGGTLSAAQFNALKGDRSGDTFYFTGKISTQLVFNIYGSPNNPVIIDGRVDGSCNPVETKTCSGGASLTGGVNQLYSNDAHTRHLIFQHFNIDGARVYLNWYSRHKPPTHITVRRNSFFNAAGMFLSVGTPDYASKASHITIEENRFDTYGLSMDESGGTNFAHVNDFIIRGNRFTGHSGITTSSNYIELHKVTRALVEYNWFDFERRPINSNMKGFAPKEHGNWDIIFRFNKNYVGYPKTKGLGFNWFTASGLYAYGNLFYGRGVNDSGSIGAMFYDGADNINFWSNIVSGQEQQGVACWFTSGRGGTKRLTNLRFYNNTFYNNASQDENYNDRAGLSIGDPGATNVFVKNNIFMNNRPNSTDRSQINDNDSRITELEHNTYYHTSGEPTVRRAGADRTISTLKSTYGLESVAPAGEVADPGFLNPAANDFRLDGTYIDNGADLTGIAGTVTVQGTTYTMRWETALHPSTDWSGQPSVDKIITVDQNDHGSGWERGAYAVLTADLMVPKQAL